jgi:hypothetical protein
MNKNGNVMIQLLLFMMGLAVLVVFLSPINTFINMAQQSDSLNCVGYVANGNVNDTLSYNSSIGTSTLSCLGIKLYLPYIVMVFLIGGVAKILYDRGSDIFGGGGQDQIGGL